MTDDIFNTAGTSPTTQSKRAEIWNKAWDWDHSREDLAKSIIKKRIKLYITQMNYYN